MNSVTCVHQVIRSAVVIVNYNGGEHLLAALDGLAMQSRVPNEIIVVDNASEDGSCMIAQQKYPECTFHFLDSNTGFAAANNYAISRLIGFDYVALLNPDAIPDENWLARLLSAAGVLPEYGSFASRMLCDHDSSVMDGAGDVYHFSGLPWRRFYQGDAKCLGLEEEEVFSACAGAALYKVSAIQEVGLFDEDYFCYVEDVDLGFRLQLAGKRCLYVPDAVVTHIGSAISDKHPGFSVYHGHRNLVWVYVKNMPIYLFCLFLPLHIAMNIVTILFFTFSGQGKLVLTSKRDALLGIPKMWKKRKSIQKNANVSSGYIWSVLNKCIIPRWKNK